MYTPLLIRKNEVYVAMVKIVFIWKKIVVHLFLLSHFANKLQYACTRATAYVSCISPCVILCPLTIYEFTC